MKKTLIYGLGKHYEIIESDYFKEHNKDFDIIGVSDNNRPKKEYAHPYVHPQQIKGLEYDLIIVTSSKYYLEIKNDLINKYFVDKDICLMDDIINEYLRESFRTNLFDNKIGLEIGGPSSIFYGNIYDVAEAVDGVNFHQQTVWWSSPEDNRDYYYKDKKLGSIIIADVTDLSVVRNKTYDFVISSNNLEHVANPMKAVGEMVRVTKSGGYILIIVPNKDTNFDHNRDITSFEHILTDYQNAIDEKDLTHLPEILEKHDYDRDKACGGKKAFEERAHDNYNNRCLHHHVFSKELLEDIYNYFDISVICSHKLINDYMILGKTV